MSVHDPTKKITGRVCPSCAREISAGGNVETCPHDHSILSFVTGDPMLGLVVGDHYEIVDVLGSGGWSVVYKARHTNIHRHVAIKVLHSHLVRDPEKVMRFHREAEAASSLLHPAVATVFDFGVLPEGQPFIVMEYLEGQSLSDVLKCEGALPLSRAVKIFSQALDGLGAAHEKGIIHRDVKPSNIFLMGEGSAEQVKLLDFGLAKPVNPTGDDGHLTQTGETIGTPDYMSPEQCLGMPLDARSDIYSFGYVMYEVLTGNRPVRGKNAFESMTSHIHDVPAPFVVSNPHVRIPPAIESVVFHTLEKQSGDRYQTANELKQALEQAAAKQDRTPELFRALLGTARHQARRAAGNVKKSPIPYLVAGTLALLVAAVGFKFAESSMRTESATGQREETNPATAWENYNVEASRALSQGDLKTARTNLEAADKEAMRLGEKSWQYSATLSKLQEVYTRLGETQLAERTRQRIAAVNDHYYWKLLGTKEGNTEKIVKLSEELVNRPDDKEIAASLADVLNNQSSLFMVDCNYDKAMEILERAQKLELKLLGDQHPQYAKTLSNMGGAKFETGQRTEGIELAQKALAIRLKSLGPDDPLVARSYRSLGEMYRRVGRLPEAELNLQKSIEIYSRAKGEGPASENYAWSVNNLGIVEMAEGKLDMAQQHLTNAMEIRQSLSGPGSIDVARTLCNLGILDAMKHNDKRAEERLLKALDLFDHGLGADKRDSGTTALYLGEVYAQFGDSANAEKYLVRAFNTLLPLEPKGEFTVRAFQDLLKIYQKEGRINDARALTARVQK